MEATLQTWLLPYIVSKKYGLLTKCEVKMAVYRPRSFFCVFMDQDGVNINFQKK